MDNAVSIGNIFASGWPPWHSIRLAPPVDFTFTIRLAEHLQDEQLRLQLSEDTAGTADTAAIIAAVRRESQRDGTPFAEVWERLERSLATLVYGSNMIESAGSNFRITMEICHEIFRGQVVDAHIDERDPTYQEHLENLAETHRKSDMHGVVRSRQEIIGHAKALNFLIDRIILSNMAWSEELLLETHMILYEGIDDDIAPGKYRDHEVAVCYSKPGEKKKKRSVCMRASVVARYMKDMVAHLNDDILEAETSGELDPYTLAARYHHQFVMIHPFGDGNGRMSRIILNTLLLQYAGHVAPFGGEGNDRDDYLEIVRRGGTVFNQEDMEVDFGEQTSHYEFTKFVLTKSRAELAQMWAWASRRQKEDNI
ncbi:Filamentation induced by cAMP/death on curing-related protein [Metarhizium rileyi]|uniref:Filamentation induced by cAMP/death on curing-related protein n=1 Tax=Metarhizium rileyi (strain RCEF 4871) TaxID=1649241 RepID=A0A166YS67_METRR|nr:Filamentation induced by cAMP/death on curing-related protein [Metarhizium rileyi RCEF 4871]